MKNAAILWTGGKDSALALFESIGKFALDRLVTFVPEPQTEFLAHPVTLMKFQAESIGLRHQNIPIRKPFKDSYVEAIAGLKESGVEVLITGDISSVNNQPNWIKQCAEGILETHMPLWEVNRKELLHKLRDNDFEVICSLAYKKDFTNTIVGKRLDSALIEKLLDLGSRSGFDPCGENGEYHTCVLSAPFFDYKLKLLGENIKETDKFYYLVFEEIEKTLKN
ncbi:MAG: diphthine--ammonia ligase [Gammaproteobacteria bacterium]|nr:diphthine--ammonia ligase [Gammaproteobacteria bacterium]